VARSFRRKRIIQRLTEPAGHSAASKNTSYEHMMAYPQDPPGSLNSSWKLTEKNRVPPPGNIRSNGSMVDGH